MYNLLKNSDLFSKNICVFAIEFVAATHLEENKFLSDTENSEIGNVTGCNSEGYRPTYKRRSIKFRSHLKMDEEISIRVV